MSLPKNKIEQWLFYDNNYDKDHLASMWRITSKEMNKVISNPHKMTAEMIHDVSKLCKKEVVEVLGECFISLHVNGKNAKRAVMTKRFINMS